MGYSSAIQGPCKGYSSAVEGHSRAIQGLLKRRSRPFKGYSSTVQGHSKATQAIQRYSRANYSRATQALFKAIQGLLKRRSRFKAIQGLIIQGLLNRRSRPFKGPSRAFQAPGGWWQGLFFCQQIVIGEGGKVEGAKGVMVPDMRAQRESRTIIRVINTTIGTITSISRDMRKGGHGSRYVCAERK